ncbi:MAG: type I glyceraldehyde-3-phosphate dehydrogenase [Dethiobacteria bacterium]|jgi:glyceraldehyde 3-phosphate dehydrogenase|nr:type I glyceraldehyde-3-phosphate dehydrogenase [Bacillota bacterium]
MKYRVGINGFGRIGRNTLRCALRRPNFEVAAINDLADSATLLHLFKYDSLYGKFPGEAALQGENMIVEGKEIAVFREKDPLHIPWKDAGVDIVIEATGKFRKRELASRHLKAGAKKVIVTAPVNDGDFSIVIGVNEDKYDPQKHHIISNASCTTNALAPIVKVLHEHFGIVKGLMNTTHSYTNDQHLLDLPHPDLRRARAAAISIIPTSTGAAKTVGVVIPELKEKIDGLAVRVPTPTVSLVDFVAELKSEVTVEAVNAAFKTAAKELEGILSFSDQPLVAADYRQDPHSCIIDGLSTMVVGGNMARVVAWYDNEWGYSTRVADLADFVAERL